ncbi:SRPBCC family protein [Schlegelella sp. S2-27]|uniref:SRPBCC family protein n=1 Tax=Caldimonas mangrovi TaxID=2944811 RepID=A0ABT0YM28_9BURK|nr:SRPBCC family protein [Caldimonas mangrovi]MCM5678933.1 SRPBCC family protein [Caldimonas mangrovi]
MQQARTVQVTIERPWSEVCAFLAEPGHYGDWASWLGPTLRRRRGEWTVQRPGGTRAKVRFTARNGYGVADHCVLDAQDRASFVALRAVPHGDACEVMATFFREPGWSDWQWLEGVQDAQHALVRLKARLEAQAPMTRAHEPELAPV